MKNFGKVSLSLKDENEYARKMKGSVADVRKPLAPAGERSGNNDALLFEDGGYLLPKTGPIAVALRKELQTLMNVHGTDKVMQLRKEKGLYNFYLQVKDMTELSAVEKGASKATGSFPRPAQSQP